MSSQFAFLNAALADHYVIEREIGTGGMATVYLARDLKHRRPVAIKVLKPELATALGTERFLREIQITALLQHPHILPLLDSGEASGLLYYVMPFVDGDALRVRLMHVKRLAVAEAVLVASEVADALDYAHSQNVLHRDIKPENVLLSRGHAIVADFGIARAVSAAGGERLTVTGMAMGSPTYMSPEQARGMREIDKRTDVYSLGCVLYEMLAGHPPLTVKEVIKQLAPAPLREVAPDVPAELDQLVMKAITKKTADRLASAGELAQALSSMAIPHTSKVSERSAGAVASGGGLSGATVIRTISSRPGVALAALAAIAVIAVLLWIFL